METNKKLLIIEKIVHEDNDAILEEIYSLLDLPVGLDLEKNHSLKSNLEEALKESELELGIAHQIAWTQLMKERRDNNGNHLAS